MKLLCLIRHAHAVSHDIMAYDHDRVLSDRGKKEANSLAKILTQSLDQKIDVVFCSSSFRTRETAIILNKSLKSTIQFNDELYNSGEDFILNLISKAKEDALAIVAHNPGISVAASILLSKKIYLEPAHTIIMTFDIKDWSDLYLNPRPINQKFLNP